MKTFITILGALLILSSCASVQTIKTASIHECVAKSGPSCSARIHWPCPEGFENACGDDPSGTHRCVAKKGPDCRTRIMWNCEEGFENGCASGKTANHECVLAASSLGGSSCAQEFAMVCAEGFIDKCLLE